MKNIFVGNLDYNASQEEIQQLFEEHGEVTRVHVPRSQEDPSRGRGFAFVEMADPEAARSAMEALNGAEFMGRTLRVNEGKPRAEGRSPRGDGGRGRGAKRPGYPGRGQR